MGATEGATIAHGDIMTTDEDFSFGPKPALLTHRELQIVSLIAEGLGRDGVAKELGLSPLTIKSHLARIKRKVAEVADPAIINVNENAGLVFYCLHKGWID